MTSQAALVVGATGVTGAPLCEELLRQGWTVYAVSRRTPILDTHPVTGRLVHLPIDLSDADSIRRHIAMHRDITHVFYCANAPTQEQRQTMIENLLDALEQAPDFANINFIQGMKYYGCHLGPFRTPARETDPRVPGCDFYYTEEDMLVRRQHGQTWAWTVLRPHSVCGYSAGNPVNVAAALAIYGSIQRELGQPFAFPGTAAAFNAVFQVMDADLLARASIYVSTHDACRNRALNINNGDVFRWSNLWPALASAFNLEPASPDGTHPSDFFERNADVWQSMISKHGLQPFPYDRLPRWCLGEYQRPNGRLSCDHDLFANTTRLRQTGFCEALDSETMFLSIFARLRSLRVIP